MANYENDLPLEAMAARNLYPAQMQNYPSIWLPFIHGEFTPLMEMCIMDKNGTKQEFVGKARVFRSTPSGPVKLHVDHIHKPYINLKEPYKGYNFSDTQQERLLKDNEAGTAVILNLNGKKTECLAGIDREVNLIRHKNVDNIFIGNKIKNSVITEKDKSKIKYGGWVLKKDLVDDKTGEVYSGILSYSAGLSKVKIRSATPELLEELKVRDQEFVKFTESRKNDPVIKEIAARKAQEEEKRHTQNQRPRR